MIRICSRAMQQSCVAYLSCWQHGQVTLSIAPTTVSNPLAPDTPSEVCSKCANIKNSGGRSCCSPGGSWFTQCGDAGDPNFDHTWSEGILACYDSQISLSRMSYEENIVQNTNDNQLQIVSPSFRTGTMDLKCFVVFIGFTLIILKVD